MRVVIQGRRPVRRAGMVGAALQPEGGRTRRGLTRSRPQLELIAELEGLRKALTQDEFESAKRHLLAG